MLQAPQVIGLVLCERFDVDPVAVRVSLVGIFHTRRSQRFPSSPERFAAYAALCDAMGEGIMRLEISRVDTEQRVYSYEKWFVAPRDRLLVLNLEIPVRKCSFPAAGRYLVRLLFDGEIAAERGLVIKSRERGAP